MLDKESRAIRKGRSVHSPQAREFSDVVKMLGWHTKLLGEVWRRFVSRGCALCQFLGVAR